MFIFSTFGIYLLSQSYQTFCAGYDYSAYFLEKWIWINSTLCTIFANEPRKNLSNCPSKVVAEALLLLLARLILHLPREVPQEAAHQDLEVVADHCHIQESLRSAGDFLISVMNLKKISLMNCLKHLLTKSPRVERGRDRQVLRAMKELNLKDLQAL